MQLNTIWLNPIIVLKLHIITKLQGLWGWKFEGSFYINCSFDMYQNYVAKCKLNKKMWLAEIDRNFRYLEAYG